MKNVFRLSVTASVLLLGLAGYQAALASPTGPYTDVLGGADYLAGSQITDLDFPVSGSSIGNPTPVYSGAYGYTGRAAFGYFFNNDPTQSWAFGLEMGYNYFSPEKSNTSKSILNALGSTSNVEGSSKTNAWAGDLDFVISEDVSQHLSMLYKIGVGYESMDQTFTSSTISGPGDFSNSTSTTDSGFGLTGGIGMQYAFSKNFAVRAEIDAMKGKKGIGYGQGLVGLVWMF